MQCQAGTFGKDSKCTVYVNIMIQCRAIVRYVLRMSSGSSLRLHSIMQRRGDGLSALLGLYDFYGQKAKGMSRVVDDGKMKQEAQLSQRDRATAVWVSFGQNITGRGYSAPKLIMYMYRPIYTIFNNCDIGPPPDLSPFGGLSARYVDYLRLIGKRVVCFMLVIIFKSDRRHSDGLVCFASVLFSEREREFTFAISSAVCRL